MDYYLQRLDVLANRNIKELANNNYSCSICGWIFKQRNDAKLHVESKHFPTDGGYVCDVCGKRTNTYNAYKTHMARNHKGLSLK